MGTERTNEERRARLFPDAAPDLWIVSAVPFAIEFVRYFKGRSESEVVKKVLACLIADLEMQEDGAIDLVRDICLETVRREDGRLH